jgi:hypothetical protein
MRQRLSFSNAQGLAAKTPFFYLSIPKVFLRKVQQSRLRGHKK